MMNDALMKLANHFTMLALNKNGIQCDGQQIKLEPIEKKSS